MRFSISAAVPLVFSFMFDAKADVWRTYVNSKFGTTAELPLRWRMEPPPVNGDGRAFTSPDGRARISISGRI